jgi:Tol biopolymer transport system component
MYFAADTGQGSHIWRQAIAGQKPEQLTFGPTQEQGVALSPDGRSLYTSAGASIRSVWVHDARGDRQLSGEGSANDPAFSADGTKVYYTVGTRREAELWVADLATGRSEIALPGVKLLARGWNLSADGHSVIYRVSTPGLWLAPLDRRSPPRRLTDRQSRGLALTSAGDIFYLAPEGNRSLLYRLQPDGTEQKAVDLSGELVRSFSISPDGRWVAFSAEGMPTQVRLLSGGDSTSVCANCSVTWGSDGHSMLLHFAALMGERAVSVALPYKGGALPTLPRGGVKSEDAAKLPGTQLIPSSASAVAGASYAYVKVNPQANLFRITLP